MDMRRSLVLMSCLLLQVAYSTALAFPGENGPIAYSIDGQVHTVTADGFNGVVDEGRSPAWSADGSQLAYVCDLQVCVSSPDGSAKVVVTSAPDGSAQQPAWSPDGEHIVYSRRIDPLVGDPTVNLYVVDLADGTETQLTDSYSSDPAWSPDGARIVFTTGVSGTGGIHSIKPDGSGRKELFAPNRYLDSPVWSPSGTRIAFAYQKGNTWRIWAMRRNGSDPHEIFKGRYHEISGRGLAWSPDGERLLFVGRDDRIIYSIASSGGDREEIATGDAPDWGVAP